MKSYTVKIPAGSFVEVGVSGDYVRLKSASVAVRIEADSGQVDATIEQGDALNLKPFQRLRVSHSDGAEQTVILLVGNGTSADSSKVGGSIAVASMPANNGAVTHSTPINLTGADAQVLAANAARRFLMIQNMSSIDVFVTLDGSAASGGIKLAPGASLTLDAFVPTGAVRSYSTGAHELAIVEG